MATYNTLNPTSNTESDDTYILMQNGINRLQTRDILSSALDQGQWQDYFEYNVDDITRGTDGKRYIALQSNGPNSANGSVDPVTDTNSVWYDCSDILKGVGTAGNATTANDADRLDGQEGSFYRNAYNLNAGTIPTARLPLATTSNRGAVEKATTSEAESGDSDKFPDAAGVHAAFNQYIANTPKLAGGIDLKTKEGVWKGFRSFLVTDGITGLTNSLTTQSSFFVEWFGANDAGRSRATIHDYTDNNVYEWNSINDEFTKIASDDNLKEIGVNQTWQDFSSAREKGVVYTNNSGKPIQISIVAYRNTSFLIDGQEIVPNTGSGEDDIVINCIVPDGSSYESADGVLRTWWELR